MPEQTQLKQEVKFSVEPRKQETSANEPQLTFEVHVPIFLLFRLNRIELDFLLELRSLSLRIQYCEPAKLCNCCHVLQGHLHAQGLQR